LSKAPTPLPPPGPIVNANPKIFRDGSTIESRPVNFVLLNGGLGDYINYCAALKWCQEENPHVIGRIWAPPPFLEVAKYLFENPKYPLWKVHDRKDFERLVIQHSLVAAPREGTQLINAPGAHLLDLGFMYYAQMTPPPPEYNYLPEIKFLPFMEPYLGGKRYAVFTPGATFKNRAMPAEAFNELIRYTKDLGIEPVFLGKRLIGPQGGTYEAHFDEGYDFSLGQDLREKTSLLEAIRIMEDAQFVIGLDNGLLHLAGTTEVPIIFGHTISPVRDRRIRRRKGLTIDISVPEDKLSCIGCQAKQRFFYNQRFSVCLYGDNLCTKLLFDDMNLWKSAIQKTLGDKNATAND
jgi:hypothetical protein